MTRAFATVMMAVAVSGLSACEDFLEPDDIIPDVPGDTIGAVPTCASVCVMAWSGDSKVLFVATPSGLYRVQVQLRSAQATPLSLKPAVMRASPTGDRVVFSADEGSNKFGIHELTVSPNSVRRIATASSRHFELGGDGRTLAFHPEGATPSKDTTVIIDIVTGARRGAMAGTAMQTLALSDDGSEAMIWSANSPAVELRRWTLATDARKTTTVPVTSVYTIAAAAWVDGDFRMLQRSPRQLTEVNDDLEPIVAYATLPRDPASISWVPSQHFAFVAIPGKCFDDGGGFDSYCGLYPYSLSVLSSEGLITPGSVNTGNTFGTMLAAPDGSFLAHVNWSGGASKYQLYLLANVTSAGSATQR